MRARPFRFRAFLVVAGLASAGATGCTDPGADPPVTAPTCEATAYRVARVDLASTWGDAARLALDLDGDGDGDNKLGSLNATLTQVYGDWRPDLAISGLLARASTGWLLRIERCEGSNRLAVSLGLGDDADGDGVFAVADWGEPAIGAGGEARGGVGFVPVGLLGAGIGAPAGAGDDAGWEPELGLAVALQPGARDLTATIGLGVEVTDELLAPVAGFLSAALADGDSRFADGIDLDRDGAVSVAELRQAPAVRTLLASDLDLTAPCADGTCYQPGGDGVLDRISLGFGVVALPIDVE